MKRSVTMGRCFAAVCLITVAAGGQNFGTITLPSSLCDEATRVERASVSTPKFNQWCEGPAVAPNGTLFFSEQLAGNVWKVTPAGAISKLVNVGSYSNGIDFNPVTGRLVVCEKARIAERDTSSGELLGTIASDNANLWTAGGSGGSNDLSFAANGDFYFTAWNQLIFFRSADGTVTRDWNFPTSYGTCNWNGIEYIEEKGILYACQYGKNRVVSFRVNSTTHLMDTATLKPFGPAINSPDGITVDSNYNVYVCSNSAQGAYPNSVVVLDSSGTVLGSIKMTQASSSVAVNCVFGSSSFGGGPNSRTLYVTGDSGAFKIQLKTGGRARPTTAVAPPRQHGHVPFTIAPLRDQQNMVSLFDLRGIRLFSMSASRSGDYYMRTAPVLTVSKRGSTAQPRLMLSR